MTVGVLLLTHGRIGSVLREAAHSILGVSPLATLSLTAAVDCDPEQVLEEARRTADELDTGDGVLVLTDVYGATPSNIACRLREFHKVRIVAGVNLPMLIRVLNYPDLDLDQLGEKAISGGREGILSCSAEQMQYEK